MKYLIGLVGIGLLHLLPYLFITDVNMLANVETFMLLPDMLIVILVLTTDDKK